MNVGFVDTSFQAKGKLQNLPHYDVPYTVRPLADVIKGRASIWKRWLERHNHSDVNGVYLDLQAQLKKQGIPISQQMKHPSDIQDIPSDVTLVNAKSQIGNDIETKLFGIRPIELPQGGGGSLWYRQGTMAETPKVQATFL